MLIYRYSKTQKKLKKIITSQTERICKKLLRDKRKMFIEIIENYLEEAVSKNYQKHRRKKGLSNTINYPSTQIDKKFSKKNC